MDSHSKYANLPFVAIGEQDVYETDELPEADQLPARDNLWDASIDIIPCGTLDAFKKFEKAEVGQLETVNASETVLQKYQRLQSEVEELVEIAKSESSESNNDLIGNIHILAEKLKNLQVSTTENSKIVENVCNQIEKSQPNDKPDNIDGVKYHLWFKPSLNQANDYVKLNSLEQRINKIENIVGGDVNKFSLLTTFTNDKNLTDAVQVLSSKVSKLDSNQLEKIDARLHMIIDKLSQISERKAQLEEIEKNSKINELYDLLFKSDKHSAQLNQVVERLENLNVLHEQAMQFSSALSHMDLIQARVNESLQNNKKQLELFEGTFKKNIDEINSVLSSFDKRIKTISS